LIVYQATKQKFLLDTQTEDIDEIILDAYKARVGQSVAQNQVDAWKHSLEAMAKVLTDTDIPSNAGIAIEYTIPQTAKRVDLLITGRDEDGDPRVVIIELKQWSEAALSSKDGVVETHIGGGIRETSHPSYQAWSYKMLLEDFNEAVEKQSIAIEPCAYLHNYEPDDVIRHEHYRKYLDEAPVFLRGAVERQKLKEFIRRHVRSGDDLGVLYTIENGRIRPSKMLADSVKAMLKGNKEFVLVDDQKVVFETAVSLARIAQTGKKQVFVVQGGPGTGKSVVAINVLARLLRREGEFKEQNCRYVSRNAAPREVYQAKLSGERGATRLRNLFCGSGSFVDVEESIFDTLVVDEAHRLNEKSGMYGVDGENQIKEIIHASRCSVFFIDEDQRVTWRDIGTSGQIAAFAKSAGAEVSFAKLESQFRCSGSDGYLAWLDSTLQLRSTANQELVAGSFDFRVFDSPVELHDAIVERNRPNNRARVVAGYCWDWNSRKDPNAFDIQIPEFDYRKQWNLKSDSSLWIIAKNSVEQVGCIHTCQGLEVDYVGVIVGDDLMVRDGGVICRREGRSRHDQSIKGSGTALRADPVAARAKLDTIIKNTYRTLMSRGMKGCYIYCTDPETRAYFKSRMHGSGTAKTLDRASAAVHGPRHGAAIIPFPEVPREAVRPYVNCIPVVDLKMAAGSFSDFQNADPESFRWIALPGQRKPQAGTFVAQVIGESMNRRIANGAWCLFRLAPRGTRAGKVVLAQLRDIGDPETGGSYTIKVYRSVKSKGDAGLPVNVQISLEPDSTDPRFAPIVLSADASIGIDVVAELLEVL
jgi:DUF2075 family protein